VHQEDHFVSDLRLLEQAVGFDADLGDARIVVKEAPERLLVLGRSSAIG
jgi:hypothetical protein